MRATLSTVATVGLLAAGTGTAVARPDVQTARDDAALHAQAVRAQGAHLAAVASATQHRPPATVQFTRSPLPDGGFDWADAGIGAGLTAALLLSAAGVSIARRQPPVRTQ
jgi:hypothetical protein